MIWPTFIAGTVLMLGAIALDPWGRSNRAAAVYLVGASMSAWAVCSS